MLSSEVDSYFLEVVGPLWQELRGGLWHSTASHRIPSILSDGELRAQPSLAPDEFRWTQLAATMCSSIDGISLFDFERADWAWLFEHQKEAYWFSFLQGPAQVQPSAWIATVWLKMERHLLPGLVEGLELKKLWADKMARNWIPGGLEACHGGPVPLAACSRAVVVCAVDHSAFRVMDFSELRAANLREIEEEWSERFVDAYRRRALPFDERRRQILQSAAEAASQESPNEGEETV